MLAAAWLAAALTACATTSTEFDDRFDPDWMAVIMVERAALPGFCTREEQHKLLGCARPFNDGQPAASAAGRGTCNIYIARDLIRDAATFDYVLRHEARHCRGWRHAGD